MAFRFSDLDSLFTGLYLEGFFYGLYSGIFALYLYCRLSRKAADGSTKLDRLLYAVCVLYVVSAATIALRVANQIVLNIGVALALQTLIAFGDFLAQCILIYRCWIVWACDFRVVIIPSFLAFAFLGIALSSNGSVVALPNGIFAQDWTIPVTASSIVLTMTVNALVTGLIVFKIFKVFTKVKPTLAEKTLGATRRSTLLPVIFILIESGMVLLAIQIVRVVLTIVPNEPADVGFHLTIGIHEMLNGITPTIILVRVSMGLSFHDEKSMIEVTEGLRFASNSMSGTDRMNIDYEERIDNYIDGNNNGWEGDEHVLSTVA
jgi:hypothetical protein